MRVVVFTSENDGAVARIEVPAAPGPKPKGKPKAVVQWLPVAIHGADADDARTRAEDFYRSELARIAAQSETRERRAQSLAEYRAAQKEARA